MNGSSRRDSQGSPGPYKKPNSLWVGAETYCKGGESVSRREMLSTFNKDPDMTMTALPEAPGDGGALAAQQELHHAGVIEATERQRVPVNKQKLITPT